MAIQKINDALPNGDTPRKINEKINENFSNPDHAASRLVGTGYGQIPLSSDVVEAFFGSIIPLKTNIEDVPAAAKKVTDEIDTSKIFRGAYYFGSTISEVRTGLHSEMDNAPYMILYTLPSVTASSTLQLSYPFNSETSLYIRALHNGVTKKWAKVYTDVNTTKDTATGYLKASSPVLHVYNDSITKIHEAEQLDIAVDKKGVGHYEIHGTTGLRKDDGWFMSPPRDVHGNVLCMVDLEEKDGVIILKTYKKLFDFETVSIVHDYDNPMDIPEGVCVEFRFNDLPEEELDEFGPEEEPEVVEEVPAVAEEEPVEEDPKD